MVVCAAALPVVSRRESLAAVGIGLTGLATGPRRDIGDARWKEVALELTSTAENSTLNWRSSFGYIEDIGDGRGYTGGIVGFCSGTGDMLTLVRHYRAIAPGNLLAGYEPRLARIMQAPYADRPELSPAARRGIPAGLARVGAPDRLPAGANRRAGPGLLGPRARAGTA